jgi:hypothetical protein
MEEPHLPNHDARLSFGDGPAKTRMPGLIEADLDTTDAMSAQHDFLSVQSRGEAREVAGAAANCSMSTAT